MIKSSSIIREKLEPFEWQQQQSLHEEIISQKVDSYLKRRSHQKKDPIKDFLFEYYAFRPSHLKRWSPGFGTLLLDGHIQEWAFEEMKVQDGHAFLDLQAFPKDRVTALHWIVEVLQQSQDRPPHFGCFGMHEWAMVYKADSIRHSYLPLRMAPEELASFVESRPLVCTHFDAFRFFTKEAKPRNKYSLSRETFAEKEQPGCLHTNMDLYKWAFKMYPWISSNLIRKAFNLALETRLIDMKASPYDLRDRGLEPIKIETDEGRRQYLEKQQQIYQQSQPIRSELIQEYQFLIESLNT